MTRRSARGQLSQSFIVGGVCGIAASSSACAAAGREARRLAEEQHARVVVDGELLLGAIVREIGAARATGYDVKSAARLEAEAAVEERPVVGDRHREDRRHARDVAVDAAGRHGDPVGVLERLDDDLDLLGESGSKSGSSGPA